MKSTQIFVEIEKLVEKPSALIESVAKDMASITIEQPIKFTCDQCGKCCETYQIGISWADLHVYLEKKLHFLLPFITLPADREYFQFMTKGEFLACRDTLSQGIIKKILQINPNVAIIQQSDEESCIFYSSCEKTCTIHDVKPLECKIYPAGFFVFHDGEAMCNPACFEQGTVLDLMELVSLLEFKRVPDQVLGMAFDASKETGWRLDFYKIALLIENVRARFEEEIELKT
nr:YkgJ family cysteine cluster protein [Candidatus Sigynarchaeota archaeon]